ncbi:MAG TPA: IS66 family transposase [Ktedonobacteraceae bacterium]|nr:IS66 family transposase [Ktedonobacteraceae bacterium]
MKPEDELIQLREENQALKEQLAQRDELIAQLLQRVQTLEERLGKDSHNSHLPPSSDRFVRQPKSLRKPSGKKPGGQPGHPGQSLRFSSSPDEVIIQRVECCQQCQANLHEVEGHLCERRQSVDVPLPHVIVREYISEQKQCPHCQHISVAPFPAEVPAPVQYGTHVGAMAVYLVQRQLLPLARVCEVLDDLVGIRMSEATVQGLIARCATNLVSVEEQIKHALRQAEVIHQDETGMHVANRRQWMHVTCTPRLTHYQVHASRGYKALDAIGILPHFTGTSVHDGWEAYGRYACFHAACNVHILRELTALAEEQGWWWAAKLKALLLDMREATEQARDEGQPWLHPLEVADWQTRYLRLLDEAEPAHPRATAPPGHRGRVKQSAARNLLDRLRKDQQAVWAFLEDLRVPFDNNLAERDLRMIKVQQKVSGCFRTFEGAQAFARIRGYLSSLRKQDLPLLSALQATLQGHPILLSFS